MKISTLKLLVKNILVTRQKKSFLSFVVGIRKYPTKATNSDLSHETNEINSGEEIENVSAPKKDMKDKVHLTAARMK